MNLRLEAEVGALDRFVLAGLLFVILVAFLANPELIPAGGGFGYDGVTYAKMVSSLGDMISRHELSPYYAQRILPSLIVRSGLIATGHPLEPENIIAAFRILNGLLLMMTAGLWVAVSCHLRLSRGGLWVGVLGIVLIFPNAKLVFYYPVLTDSLAFCLGIAMVWAHVTGRSWLVALLAILGSFAWQMSSLVGMALVASTLVAPLETNAARADNIAGRMTVALLVASALAAAAVAMPVLLGFHFEQLLLGRRVSDEVLLRVLTNIPALALAGCFVIYLGAYALATRWLPVVTKSRVAIVVGLLIAMLAVPAVIVHAISNPELPPPGIAGYSQMLWALLVDRVRSGLVLLPLVSHAVYYGPVFLLLLIFWRSSAACAVRLGAGFTFVLAVFAVMSVFSESRFTFMLWPFVVTVVSLVVSRSGLSKPAFAITVLCAVGFSKMWLQINQGPWPKPDMADLLQWPKSVYFASFGPWMSVSDYLLQGALAVLCLVALLLTIRGTWRRSPQGLQ